MILIEHHVMVKVNNISRFFRDEIEIFSNLVVRDEIEICFFYISCFETRSRICFTTSRISRRGRETKQLILEVEREFSMLILARHFEIENSRQCLVAFHHIDCPVSWGPTTALKGQNILTFKTHNGEKPCKPFDVTMHPQRHAI